MPVSVKPIVLIVIRLLLRLRDTGASLEHLHVCQASYNGFVIPVTSADKCASQDKLDLMLHIREAEQEGVSWIALDARLMPQWGRLASLQSVDQSRTKSCWVEVSDRADLGPCHPFWTLLQRDSGLGST